MKKMAVVSAFVFASLLSIMPASGDDAPTRLVCVADLERLCPGLLMGSETAMRCLRSHQTEVSKGCRVFLAARRDDLLRRVRAACGSDIARFCSEQRGVAPRTLRCLRRNVSLLSETCRASLPRSTS